MTTCVTLDCPFICFCSEYNYLVDRGEECEHMEQIIKKAKRFDMRRRGNERHNTIQSSE